MTIVLHCLAGLLHVGVVEYYIVASLHPRKSCHFLLLFKFCYNSIGMSVAVAPDLKKKIRMIVRSIFFNYYNSCVENWAGIVTHYRLNQSCKCSLNMYIYWPFKINTFLCLAVGMSAWFPSKSRVVMHDVAILISFQTILKTNVAISCHWNEEHVLKNSCF